MNLEEYYSYWCKESLEIELRAVEELMEQYGEMGYYCEVEELEPKREVLRKLISEK